MNNSTSGKDPMESGELNQNSLRNFRKHSSQEYRGNSQQGNWEIPEAGELIIKEEIKEEEDDDDIEFCGEIRVVSPRQPTYNGTPALLEQRPPQLLQYALSQPVSPEVEFTANEVLQQIEAQLSQKSPRSVPVILPQHNQQPFESQRSSAYLSFRTTSPSSPSYPQQRQNSHSPEQAPRRNGSNITSKPPMPNLIPIPRIGEAIPSIMKDPPPYVEPSIRIVEHPRENSLRFRYECEGRSAGSLQGVTSTSSNKTFPSIEILNYRGPAMVVVSCVNATGSPLAHPHNLVGKDCKKGVCVMKINNDSMFCMFQNMGVQCVKRRDIATSLTQREGIRVDPYKQGFQHKNSPNKIDLNAVRLCFQVFLMGHKDTYSKIIEPVLSTPVYDAKSKKNLEIIELSDDESSADGGRKILILCEKVAKDDIEVNFFEEDEEGNRTWEALGDFRQSDVHKQYGICLRTPRYRNRFITSTVRVNIELRKTSNRTDTSDPLPFYFNPIDPSTSPQSVSPFIQSHLPMVEVSMSEEDVPSMSEIPTIILPSHISTASEDDVTRAVYNQSSATRRELIQRQTSNDVSRSVYNTPPAMRRQLIHRPTTDSAMQRQLIQRQTSKSPWTDSTSTQGMDDNLDVSPQKRMKF